MMLLAIGVHAQKSIITGTVTDTAGKPLANANVSVKGTKTGTVTNSAGAYSISAKPGDVLVISFVNYISVEVAVEVPGSALSVQLAELKSNLDEVIVVGYGSQRKKEVTGATVRVGGGDLDKNRTPSLAQSLQGQAAGVQVTSSSGQPGDPMKIVIRGTGTNGNANPLYVVDGMPADDISYLSSADIETIDILKDAASSAIYGARAANGVVLITTRKGRVGKRIVAFDAYYGWQNPTKKLDMLNAKQYAIIMNEAAVNSGNAPYHFYSQDQIDSMGAGTDWQKEVANKNAATQSYTLGISGGNDASVFSTSLGYQRQEGLMGIKGKSFYERISLRVNSEHKLYKDIVKIGENLTYTHSNQAAVGTGNIYGNSIRGLLNTSPTFPAYNKDGSYGRSTNPEEINPVAAMDYLNNNTTQYDRLLGNIYVEATLVKGLKFRSDFGMATAYNNYVGYSPVYELSATSVSNVSSVTNAIYKNQNWNWDNTLTYNVKLDKHNISILAGTTAKEDVYTYVSGSKTNLVIPGFEYAVINNGTTIPSLAKVAAGTREETALQSYFGRVNYNFNDKYLLSVIVRRDGSSKFGPNQRYGYFPSFSAGWIVTNEAFFRPDWMSFLKIRGGWGRNGNDRITNFAYQATVSSLYRFYYFNGIDATGATLGTSPDKIANPNLKWEASEQKNIGFDATVFKFFNITFDWYNKTTRDWLIQPAVPDIVGTGAPYINGGDVENKGVEIAINYQRKSGEVSYNIGGNIAFNTNKVTRVATQEEIIHGASGILASNTDEFYRIQKGFPLGYFWGYKTNGIFQNEAEVNNYIGKKGAIQSYAKPGDVRFVDVNGDGEITAADKTQIGNPHPKFSFGLNLSASWRAFDISILAAGVGGNDILDGTRATDRYYNNYTTETLKRWTGEGTSNRLPRVTLSDEANKNWGRISDLYLHSGTYLRIKSINIGYDLKKTLLPNLPFQQCRIYVTGLNLLTFTGYRGIDPEVGYGNVEADKNQWSSGIDLGYYPQPRTLMAGVSVKF
ncbi:TonB-dependent receptor [Filimonas lacunae]|nr:TonB-dependent receptor [Filimonas lacunae]